MLLSALMRWYASLPVPAAKLLINAVLSANEKWRTPATDAFKELTKVLTVFIDRELERRHQNKILARTVARTLLMIIFQMKMTTPEAKSAKKELDDANLEAVLQYCLIGLQEQ